MASGLAQIFGILNITADSFSDGGQYLDPPAAIAHAEALVQDGAQVLDIGAASSHPDAEAVPPSVEIERLDKVWSALRNHNAALSVDSFQPETQRWAMAHGADWLNDINGFAEPSLYDELADYSGRLVVMHAVQSKGIATRAAPPKGDIWQHIFRFFETRLTALDKAGISRDRLVLDPGMGFFLGSKPQTSMAVLAGLNQLKPAFGLPVMVCVSRKSFLRDLVGVSVENSGAVSLAAEMLALQQGVDFIRTHHVRQLAQAIQLVDRTKTTC